MTCDIDTVELPEPNASRAWVAKPADYYPFRSCGRDEGKRLAREVERETPDWVEDVAMAWMFRGLGAEDGGVYFADRGAAGQVRFRVRSEYDRHAVMNHVSHILSSCATSHEQKSATAKLLIYRWCELVE